MAEVLAAINPAAPALAAHGDTLAAFLNGIPADMLDELFQRISPDLLVMHGQIVEGGLGPFLLDLDPDQLDAYLDRLDDAEHTGPIFSVSHNVYSQLLAKLGLVADDPFDPENDDTLKSVIEDKSPVSDPPDDPEPVDVSGSCFVATAAYRDPCHRDVVYLRLVRDQVLVHHLLGRWFIWGYWRIGPVLAGIVNRYPRLRPVARNVIERIVARLQRKSVLERFGGISIPSNHLRPRRR